MSVALTVALLVQRGSHAVVSPDEQLETDT